MQLSDIDTRTGIIELIEDNTGTQSATDSTYPRTAKIRDVNNAYANLMLIAQQAEGRWQVDDTNHADLPIFTFDVVQNQQDYTFTVDGSTPANQVTSLYRVEIKDVNGQAYELSPMDEKDVRGIAMTEFFETAGRPVYYDLVGNTVLLYPKPDYNYTDGLRFYYSRTPSYFTVSATEANDTKKPGVPDRFHEYLALRPSYQFCLRKGMPQTSNLKADMLQMEELIREFYSKRAKYERPRWSSVRRSSR